MKFKGGDLNNFNFVLCSLKHIQHPLWLTDTNWSTLKNQLIHTFESVWAMYDILVAMLSFLGRVCEFFFFFFCWAFPFIISRKEVEPRNVFCCSADFGFFFKKIEEFWFFIIEGSGGSRWDGKIPVSTRIPEPNTLGCWEVWGTLGNGPNTFRASLMY